MTLSNSLPFTKKKKRSKIIEYRRVAEKPRNFGRKKVKNKAVLRSNRASLANDPSIFLLPSFLNENVMLDFRSFWYELVMFEGQPKIYSAISTVRLCEKPMKVMTNN